MFKFRQKIIFGDMMIVSEIHTKMILLKLRLDMFSEVAKTKGKEMQPYIA